MGKQNPTEMRTRSVRMVRARSSDPERGTVAVWVQPNMVGNGDGFMASVLYVVWHRSSKVLITFAGRGPVQDAGERKRICLVRPEQYQMCSECVCVLTLVRIVRNVYHRANSSECVRMWGRCTDTECMCLWDELRLTMGIYYVIPVLMVSECVRTMCGCVFGERIKVHTMSLCALCETVILGM